MKKRIIIILIINILIYLYAFTCYAKTKIEPIEIIEFEDISKCKKNEIDENSEFQNHEITFSIMTAIEVEYTNKMAELEWTEDIMKWFIEYKEMIDKYKEFIDEPETIYDVYSDEEIYLMQRVIETETYQRDFLSKCNVASVLINRIEDSNKEFGRSVEEVITTPNQFAYVRKNISEDTKLALEFVYSIKDTTDGAIAFHSNKNVKPEWYGWVYKFSDNSHHFYERNQLLYE